MPTPIAPRLSTPRTLVTRLTKRELQIIAYTAAGYSQKEIAVKLSIAFRTVTSHRFNIFRKTGLQCAQDITRLALSAGLVQE